MGDHRRTGRALIASFAGVAIAFMLGDAAAHFFSLRIQSAAREITGNSSPTISYLSSMRGTLRQLEVLATDLVNACADGSCAPPPRRTDDLRRSLRDGWMAYRQLPTFPDEAEPWPEVEEALARLEEALTLTFAAVSGGDAAEASRRLSASRPAFDRLDQAVAFIADSDHAQGLAVAARIDDLARLSVTTSVALDLVAIALTVLSAVLAIRFVRRHERSLRQRADDLDQFAGRVAHDIMSPLGATAAALHLARRDVGERGLAALDRGQSSLRRVQRLVEGLLEFARAGAARSGTASVDVGAVLEDVVAELRTAAEAAQVALRVEASGVGPVGCSPGVLTSVLSNLVRNSIVHMGGSDVRGVIVRAHATASSEAVRIEVEDTGPGIPVELGDRIFEPFVRGREADQPGNGLGLATAKRLVEAHGGRIGFHPAPLRGTVFWLELPATPGAQKDGVASPQHLPLQA